MPYPAGIRSLARSVIGCRCLEDLSRTEREVMWPAAAQLEPKHLQNCRVVEHRERLLEHVPAGGVCAELGILECNFSQKIWEKARPARLHLIDNDPRAIGIARSKFAPQVAAGTVRLHQGDTSETMLSLPENYLDWAYLDADHSYAKVKQDLEAVRTRLKPDGSIALNDYVFFASSGMVKYGVIEAVHEFCLKHDFEFLFLALQCRSYNDVVIRKIGAAGL